MAYVAWTDSAPRTLGSPVPAPGNRFASWSPWVRTVGPRAHPMAPGAPPVAFVFARRWLVTFTITELRPADLDAALRFQAHFEGGGYAVLHVGNPADSMYGVYIAEGATVTISPPDQYNTYALTTTAEWADVAAGPMLALF